MAKASMSHAQSYIGIIIFYQDYREVNGLSTLNALCLSSSRRMSDILPCTLDTKMMGQWEWTILVLLITSFCPYKKKKIDAFRSYCAPMEARDFDKTEGMVGTARCGYYILIFLLPSFSQPSSVIVSEFIHIRIPAEHATRLMILADLSRCRMNDYVTRE